MWGSLEVVRDPTRIGSGFYRKGLFLAAFQACPFTLGIM